MYGLIFHRKKIRAFARILANTVLSEKIKRLKIRLGKLDELNYDVKEQRKEIIASLGDVAGMLKGFAKSHQGFSEAHIELIGITELKETLTEPKKRRIVQEIYSLLDDHTVDAAVTLINDNHG